MRKSNSMEVKNMVRRHIAESLDATTVEELRQALSDMEQQIKVNRTRNMSYHEAVAYTIDGLYEGFLFRTHDIKQFIDSLELNNKSNKEYDDGEYFDMYKYLIARELPYMEKLSNKKLSELLWTLYLVSFSLASVSGRR